MDTDCFGIVRWMEKRSDLRYDKSNPYFTRKENTMCTRFVYRGNDILTGFNFEIDLAVWDHKIIKENDRFYIGILRPDGARHAYHGVNCNGNAGTLLYVHGNQEGAYHSAERCMTIADLTEQFIQARISFDDARRIVQEQKIVYAPDATMQAMLSDRHGRTLIVEPGIGWREDEGRYSLMTNSSVLSPERTLPFLMPGDDRYERAAQLLRTYGNQFTVSDAFSVLQSVRQEGCWATRVSFVYSANEHAVYYTENNHFSQIERYRFPSY